MKRTLFRLFVLFLVPMLILSGCGRNHDNDKSTSGNDKPVFNEEESNLSGANPTTESTTNNSVNTEKPSDKKPSSNEPVSKEPVKDANSTSFSHDPSVEKLIALTFDDGPSEKNSPRILEILKANHSKATFFVVGTNVNRYPENLKSATDMGCEIGSHSYAHGKFTKMTPAQITEDVTKMKKLISAATGIEPKLFRAPYGSFNDTVKSGVGMPLIQWSIDTNDWKYKTTTNESRTEAELKRDKQKIIDEVLNNAKDGDIVLMHDLYAMTADACEIMIPELVSRGFKLVTVSELMAARGVEMKNGEIYRKSY